MISNTFVHQLKNTTSIVILKIPRLVFLFDQHEKPPQATSHSMTINISTAPAIISFIRRLCSHIFRRSCLPCLWKLSAWIQSRKYIYPHNHINYKVLVPFRITKQRKFAVPGTADFRSCPPEVRFFPHGPKPANKRRLYCNKSVVSIPWNCFMTWPLGYRKISRTYLYHWQ